MELISFRPVFGRRLQAQTVRAGSRVTMEVEVTGTPVPDVSWSKDGRVRIEVVSSCGSGQPRMNHVVMSGRMLDTLRPQDGRSSGRRRCFAYEPGDGEVA